MTVLSGSFHSPFHILHFARLLAAIAVLPIWLALSTSHSLAGDTAAKTSTGCSFDFQAWRAKPQFGVNLAGAAFAPEKIPGTFGKDFTYPTLESLDYWRRQGVRLIRVTFQWERLQPALFGQFDSDELQRIRTLLEQASERDFSVILGPHNYARYRINGKPQLIGTTEVPTAAFGHFWRQLARELRDAPGLFGFALMNEPHDTKYTWKTSAQAGLDGIRMFDRDRLVIVPGDDWSSAERWKSSSADLLLEDPSRCLMYEAHVYFDANSSGFYTLGYDANGAYPQIGAERVGPFLEWLEQHQFAGIITEFGVPQNDPRWLPVVDNFLQRIRAAGVGGTYWAAGPWWGEYPLSIEPRHGIAAPAMSVLSKYIDRPETDR